MTEERREIGVDHYFGDLLAGDIIDGVAVGASGRRAEEGKNVFLVA